MKLIAEPWDASGDGYRVGEFPPPWVEWNDQFRDEIRDFWLRGKPAIRDVATRLAGSSDLYADDGRSPYASVNFVTAHDGFTVRDLVSFDHKHNEANGEDNRDGTDNNRSWNHGVEGETDDEEILRLRRRSAANLMATLCLSNGVPMITAGDERGRTQGGNNNPTARTTRPRGSTGGPTTPGSTSTRSPRPRFGYGVSTPPCVSGTGSRAGRRCAAAPRTWRGCTRTAAR